MHKHFDVEKFIASSVTKRPESLLKKDLEKYHPQLSKNLSGKNVMVIGGAGTIGSWYIKAILKFNIAKLVVVDVNENGLTELVRDLRSSTQYNIPAEFITYPINFADPVFEKLLKHHGPFQVVANFAAHKHVRSEKDIFSIEAMVENNVLRAQRLIEMLSKTPIEHFFCVSTDKAANPVNIMGASKKLMEELIMAYSDIMPITTARFANVAFSNGSLPLGFLDRLSKKQPWSCPKGIRRFFVSPQESGELCMIASVLGKSGDIFFPKLDPDRDMIPFDEIALDLIKSLGYTPDICQTEDEAREKALRLTPDSKSYPIYFFESDTSGEKSFEEFFTENEVLDNQTFNALGIVKNSIKRPVNEINTLVDSLRKTFNSPFVEKSAIVAVLKNYLPNFDHIETGKGLDQKM
jgi:FlaA1/EpsC-like NDP-sugar epimerase